MLIPKEDIPAAVAMILGKDVAEVEAILARVSGPPPPPPPGEENGSKGDGEEEHWFVRFIREINRSNRHHASGRPLEPHEASVLWAAAYAYGFPKTKKRYRLSAGQVRMDWTVDKVLSLLGIHENTRRGRELKRYLRDFGLQHIGADPYFPWRPDVTPMDIYREALLVVVDRVLRQEVGRPGRVDWREYETPIKYLHRAINGPAGKPWQGEAWRIARDLAGNSRGWGSGNYRRAKEDGKKLSVVTQLQEWMLKDGAGLKRGGNAPEEGPQDPRADNANAGWKRAWDEGARQRQALNQAHAKRLKDLERIPKKDYVLDPEKHVVYPPDKALIEAEREHWKGELDKPGTPIGFPCYNGPYMGSEFLEFWDKEREAARRIPELPAQQRRVAILLHIGDFDYRQISQTLRIKESTTRTHASEAHKRLLDLAGKGG